MDLVASPSNGVVDVTVFCRPRNTYLLLASTNLLDWIPLSTNTPVDRRFDCLDIEASTRGHRYFRAVMLEHLFDTLGLSLNSITRRATLTVSNAQPNHTLVLQTSEDLRHWTSLFTNTPASVVDWQILDPNASAFDKRFYRATGQGK